MKNITVILPLHKLDDDYKVMLDNALTSVEQFHDDVKLSIVCPSNLKKELENISEKLEIENEIEKEFDEAFIGIRMLPKSARFGVYLSYNYYKKLLLEIKRKTINDLLTDRIRVSDRTKKFIYP